MPVAYAVLLTLTVSIAEAQQAASSAAQAYYEFMLARHLESQGDEAGALEALKRAQAADPRSAEIRAEFAGFYARQNKGAEAVTSAEQALALDPNSSEAHRILGLVFAAWSDGGVKPPPGRTAADLRLAAIDHLTKILNTPAVATDLGLQVTLGRLLLRASQPEKAIPVLETVVSQSPFAVEPYALLAEARLAVGRVDEAADALEMAAEIDPRRYAALAELYERTFKWAEAADAYTKAVAAVRSPSRDLRMRMAAALLNVPGGEGAVRARDTLKELLSDTPNDARALSLLSTAHRTLGDYAGAEDAARKLIALDPNNLDALYALSQVYLVRREGRKVVDLLAPFFKDIPRRAKDHEADAALVLVQLGFAHLQLSEFQQAVDVFTQAKNLVPKNPAFDGYLVQAHLNARQFARAADVAAEALTRHPTDARLLQLRATALSRAGRRDEAVKLLQDASARAPEDDELTLRLGAVLEEAGRVDDAEKAFRRVLDRDPLHADALNGLGYMLADRGLRLTEAIALIERALKIDPENPAYLDSLGWALFKDGRVDAAEAPLRKAAEALVDESVIQDHFGDVLARRGKADEAIAAWERALSGNGDSIDRAAIQKKINDARARRR